VKVLITGKAGQLAQTLLTVLAGDYDCIALDRHALDVTDPESVEVALETHAPRVVINTAAYTQVDSAELHKEEAYAANEKGPAVLAKACKHHQIRLIHISTDFVFSGEQSKPYKISDEPSPVNIYGKSKLAGERAVLLSDTNNLVMRTAWVYAAFSKNFVTTMLNLMQQRDVLSVVADQVGTPTSTHSLALAIQQALKDPSVCGIHHFTDAGVASWYDFACAIQEIGLDLGLLTRSVSIKPISTIEYPTPAKRPSYSVLDKQITWEALKLDPVHWRSALQQVLKAAPQAVTNNK